MKVSRILSVSVMLILACMMLVAPTCPAPDLRIESFTTSHAYPADGTKVQLKWDYTPDLDAALTEQTLRFMTVRLERDGMKVVAKTLPNDKRDYSFMSAGTVGIKLTAKVQGQKDVSAYLDCIEPNSGTYHLKGRFSNRGGIVPSGIPGFPIFYPDLGCYLVERHRSGCDSSIRFSVSANPKTIDFTTCFGAYDGKVNYKSATRVRSKYNGKLDSLQPLMSDKYPFRAFTSDPQEQKINDEYFRVHPDIVGYFRMNDGCLYPPTYEELSVKPGVKEVATNVIIYGGALVPDGKPGETYLTEIGQEETATIYEVTGVQPVFIAVAVYFPDRFAPRKAVTPAISDIQVGNLKQELICARFNNNLTGEEVKPADVDYSTWNWQVDGAASDYLAGDVKSAAVGSGIMLFGGAAANVFVDIEELSFKVPFAPDTKIVEYFSPAPPPDLE